MPLLSALSITHGALSDRDRLLRNLKDYAEANFALTWQKQSIFAAVSLLTGAFFDVWKAVLFFTFCMACELIDLTIARHVRRLEKGDTGGIYTAFSLFMLNTLISAVAIASYAVWVAVMEDGVALFTALFCLFAAALFAAMNNHQLVWTLSVRLAIYGLSFLFITVKDLYIHRPPLHSEMWLQFFTVIFVLYFLIDCSLGFLRLYRQNLRHIEDLQAEHERTKAALVVKSQFVSVVSHELRTPLTSIKGSLDLINSGKIGEVNAQVRPLLDMASKNSRRLAHLVDDLLDLQKIEAGEMKFKDEDVNVRTLLSDAVATHQGLAERFRVTLVGDGTDGPPIIVRADESRLMQVLSNMISNAAKFSPEGENVTIGCETVNDTVVIFVKDRGTGIPKGSKEKVFGRFTQLDSSDQRKIGGTGLGMNISREIVEAFNGNIDYDSEPGKGTTFFIELPIAQARNDREKGKAAEIIPLPTAANG